jgi:hypothetical protein
LTECCCDRCPKIACFRRKACRVVLNRVPSAAAHLLTIAVVDNVSRLNIVYSRGVLSPRVAMEQVSPTFPLFLSSPPLCITRKMFAVLHCYRRVLAHDSRFQNQLFLVEGFVMRNCCHVCESLTNRRLMI